MSCAFISFFVLFAVGPFKLYVTSCSYHVSHSYKLIIIKKLIIVKDYSISHKFHYIYRKRLLK